MARKTLAELNATYSYTHGWDVYTLDTFYAVGSQSRRWTSSPKIHLLRCELVVAEAGQHKPGTYKVGDVFSAHTPCNSNGQHTGTPFKGLDTDAITCSKCLKVVDR